MINNQNLVRQSRELNSKSSLTNLLYPSADGGWRDIYRSGWLPGWFNQQWGGAQWGTEMVDGATGVTYKFDVGTGVSGYTAAGPHGLTHIVARSNISGNGNFFLAIGK